MEGLGFCCIASFAFMVFLIVWAGVGERIKVRRFWLYMAASLPTFIVLLFLTLFALYAMRGVFDACTSASYVFEHSFGFAPTQDVQIAYSTWRTDDLARGQYLKFYADQRTIDRIVAAKSLQRGERVDVLMRRNEDPSWWECCWSMPEHSNVYGYCGNNCMRPNGDQEYHTEDEALIYDPKSRQAYYRYLGSNR